MVFYGLFKNLLKIWWFKLFYLIFTPLDPDPNKKLGVWIRMDIFEILDPDPHENLCGSETLVGSYYFSHNYREKNNHKL